MSVTNTTNKKHKNVVVLFGGWNAERDVSLSSGREVAKALEMQGYNVKTVDVDGDMQALLKALDPKPDVVFMNSLHGHWVEDGCLQGLIEILGIPYTNSGVLPSALAMDKLASKKIWTANGLQCTEGDRYHRDEIVNDHVMDPPYVIKPIAEGSSVGVHIIRTKDDLSHLDDVWDFGDYVLVEKYVPGRELSVCVMHDKAVGAIEICPKEGFYDYKTKYTDGLASHPMPAPIHPKAYEESLAMALKAHQLLGCEGVTRSDFRYDDTAGEPGKLYLIELNTQPGMTPHSLVPEIVADMGMSFGELCQWMVENPRYPEKKQTVNQPENQKPEIVKAN